MTPLEWVKGNATLKDSAKIAEFEALLKDLDPLKNLSTVDQALDFMKRNSLMDSALKKHETQAIEKHDAKFTTDKLPGLLKAEGDKIRLELNPKETEAEKRMRAIEDELAGSKKIISDNAVKATLRTKAKEIGYTGDAERYSIYGENAIDAMIADKKAIDETIETAKKEFYKDNPKPTTTELDPDKTMTRADYDNLSPQAQSDFIVNNSGVVTD